MAVNVKNRLMEIQDEFCPLTEQKYAESVLAGNYDPCGCAICNLLRDMTIEEVRIRNERMVYCRQRRISEIKRNRRYGIMTMTQVSTDFGQVKASILRSDSDTERLELRLVDDGTHYLWVDDSGNEVDGLTDAELDDAVNNLATAYSSPEWDLAWISGVDM